MSDTTTSTSTISKNQPALSPAQREQFWRDGYLMVENAVSPELLQQLQDDFNHWVQTSRDHPEAWDSMIDGRPRFDVAAGHGADSPALRRVNAPIEVARSYYEATTNSRMTQCVADLIGPDVKLHHTKINSKLPGSLTEVKWHQDFPFTPHTNDDVITALLMIDEVTDENGPLEVLPGSHTEDIHGLWHNGIFTGAIDDEIAEACKAKSVRCKGPAGSVCLMHTRLLHGSTPNNSNAPRTLHISVYSAADALCLVPNPVPTKFEGLMVRGSPSKLVRATAFELELPQKPSTASFFDQQDHHDESTQNM